MDTLELRFPPSARYVRIAAQMASNLGAILCRAVSEPERDKEFNSILELVVSEACTNAVKHGSKSDDAADVIMKVIINDETMIIKIKDCNEPFDFTDVKEPDLENHPENGYGIFLMKNFMDEVSYSHEEGWNCITLVKHKPCRKKE